MAQKQIEDRVGAIKQGLGALKELVESLSKTVDRLSIELRDSHREAMGKYEEVFKAPRSPWLGCVHPGRERKGERKRYHWKREWKCQQRWLRREGRECNDSKKFKRLVMLIFQGRTWTLGCLKWKGNMKYMS